MTTWYTIGSHKCSLYEDVWTIPALVGSSVERQRGELSMRIPADGIACDPMTAGRGGEQRAENILTITPHDVAIRGWGDLDGPAYRVGHALVPTEIIAWLADFAGLRIGAATGMDI